MKSSLPRDLIAFLEDGHQLEYDVDRSSIGNIRLKSAEDLAISTIALPDGCQSILEDPYSELNGHYHVEVVDLVAESDDYDPQGLLCWIVPLQQFGMLDPEHGDVLVFPGATWTDITAAPLNYLDALWGDDEAAERVLPWPYFDFEACDSDLRIKPYGPSCPVHGVALTKQQSKKPLLYDVLRRREPEDWLQNYLAKFPCSGVPVAEGELLCCPDCRTAEDAWIKSVEESITPIDAKPNETGWILCPGCGIRFSLGDADRFAFTDATDRVGVHLSCGQKLRVGN